MLSCRCAVLMLRSWWCSVKAANKHELTPGPFSYIALGLCRQSPPYDVLSFCDRILAGPADLEKSQDCTTHLRPVPHILEGPCCLVPGLKALRDHSQAVFSSHRAGGVRQEAAGVGAAASGHHHLQEWRRERLAGRRGRLWQGASEVHLEAFC